MSAADYFREKGGHISSVDIGPLRAAALARLTRLESMISLLFVISGAGYLSTGWGWDQRFPLRPWPVPWAAPPDAEGRVYRSLTWFGFWVGVAL